jgi:hypothetical protein
MATQSVTQGRPQEVKPRQDDGMVEVKEPEFIQWKRQGQETDGILLSLEPQEIEDKESKEKKTVTEMMFIGSDGQRFRFLAPDDLKKKIWTYHLGHRLRIRYETDDTSRQQQGQNARKIFKVVASPNKMSGFEHLG